MDQQVAARTLAHIDAQHLVGLASDLIRIPSFSPDETPAARFLADYSRPRGYDVVMQEVEPGRFQTIATLKGAGGRQEPDAEWPPRHQLPEVRHQARPLDPHR